MGNPVPADVLYVGTPGRRGVSGAGLDARCWGTGEYLAPEGLKTLHMGQTEVTWSMLPWTKHMLVVGEEEGLGKIVTGRYQFVVK